MRLYSISPKQPVSKPTTSNLLLREAISKALMIGGETGYFSFYQATHVSRRMALYIVARDGNISALYRTDDGRYCVDTGVAPPQSDKRYTLECVDIVESPTEVILPEGGSYRMTTPQGIEVSSPWAVSALDILQRRLDDGGADKSETALLKAALNGGLYLNDTVYTRPSRIVFALNGQSYSWEVDPECEIQPITAPVTVKGYNVTVYQFHVAAQVTGLPAQAITNTQLAVSDPGRLLASFIMPNEPTWWQPRLGDFVKLRRGDDDSLYVLSEYRGTDDDWVIVAAYDKDDHKPPYYVSLSDIKPYFVINR